MFHSGKNDSKGCHASKAHHGPTFPFFSLSTKHSIVRHEDRMHIDTCEGGVK